MKCRYSGCKNSGDFYLIFGGIFTEYYCEKHLREEMVEMLKDGAECDKVDPTLEYLLEECKEKANE